MEDILKKNLDYIAKHNSALCEKILCVTELTKAYEIKTNLVNEYNLLINNKPVHSLIGAQNEATMLFEKLKTKDNTSVHVIFGVGLGYLVDAYFERTKGKIVVFEPDIETLYFVLSAVDFSQNFESERLFFVSDNNEFENVLGLLYRYKTSVTFSYLDYYKLYCKDEVESFKTFLQRKVELVDHNISFQVRSCYSFFTSTLQRLHEKYEQPFLTDYKDAFKGKPALIVSAGPSLHKNIEYIKKYQDNALIFCVGTALGTLYNNGITPDYVNVIERNITRQHYDLPFAKDITFIGEPFTEAGYLDVDFKQSLMTASLETDDARWFLEKADKELVEFETKGTVAYHSIYSAYYLGCNPIILIGQDLAYTDGECYSKGSKFDGLKCVMDEETKEYKIMPVDFEAFKNAYCAFMTDYPEGYKLYILEQRIKELNDNLYFVKGQENNMLPTDAVYSLFIDYIQWFAKAHGNERKLINTSVGGALIEGFETMPLEKAFVDHAPINLNKEELKNSVNFESKIDMKCIKDNLKKDIEILAEVSVKITKGLNIATNLKKEINSRKVYTSKASDMLSKLSDLYVEITNKYMLEHRVIKMLALELYSEINYLTREFPVISDYENAKKYFEAYLAYFVGIDQRIKETLIALNTAKEGILDTNESCTPKS